MSFSRDVMRLVLLGAMTPLLSTVWGAGALAQDAGPDTAAAAAEDSADDATGSEEQDDTEAELLEPSPAEQVAADALAHPSGGARGRCFGGCAKRRRGGAQPTSRSQI